MSLTYKAKSLEDIAEMFDSFANNTLMTVSKPKTTNKGRELALREIYVWRRAADMLRNTEMVQS